MFTVKNLIAALSELDQDAYVVAGDRDWEVVQALEVDTVTNRNEGRFNLDDLDLGDKVVKLYV